MKKNHKSEREHLEKRLKDRKSDHEAKISEYICTCVEYKSCAAEYLVYY